MKKEEFDKLKEKSEILKKAASILRVDEKDLPRVIERFKKEIKEMEEEIQRLTTKRKTL